jgi:hypothetical protein
MFAGENHVRWEEPCSMGRTVAAHAANPPPDRTLILVLLTYSVNFRRQIEPLRSPSTGRVHHGFAAPTLLDINGAEFGFPTCRDHWFTERARFDGLDVTRRSDTSGTLTAGGWPARRRR